MQAIPYHPIPFHILCASIRFPLRYFFFFYCRCALLLYLLFMKFCMVVTSFSLFHFFVSILSTNQHNKCNVTRNLLTQTRKTSTYSHTLTYITNIRCYSKLNWDLDLTIVSVVLIYYSIEIYAFMSGRRVRIVDEGWLRSTVCLRFFFFISFLFLSCSCASFTFSRMCIEHAKTLCSLFHDIL